MEQPDEQHECGVDAVSISLAPIVGAEADHLLVLSDEYMASLYPAESNHLVSSESLRAGDAVFLRGRGIDRHGALVLIVIH